jgi:hypothetical protein
MPSNMAAISAPTERRRLRPGLRSYPGGTSAAGASPGSSVRTSSQAGRDGSHRSSRISAARPCSASTSYAMRSAIPAASAVAAYKKKPVFPALTEISALTRLRSRSRTLSREDRFLVAGWPWTARLTRHSSSTSQVYVELHAGRSGASPSRAHGSPAFRISTHEVQPR